MKIWTSEHVFQHNWEKVAKSQWQKYPNPHNQAVLGTDVIDRHVDPATGILHSSRIICSDWGLAPWVQSLIGANRVCHGYEYSTVDPRQKVMRMESTNLTFCNFVSMRERMTYTPHPEDPSSKTLFKQEMVVTVQGVPLTSYMESLILNTVSSNAAKGRQAMDWVVDKLGEETKSLSCKLDQLKLEVQSVAHGVEERIVSTAKASIDELQRDLKRFPPILRIEDASSSSASEQNKTT